jgi:hypothetical protein
MQSIISHHANGEMNHAGAKNPLPVNGSTITPQAPNSLMPALSVSAKAAVQSVISNLTHPNPTTFTATVLATLVQNGTLTSTESQAISTLLGNLPQSTAPAGAKKGSGGSQEKNNHNSSNGSVSPVINPTMPAATGPVGMKGKGEGNGQMGGLKLPGLNKLVNQGLLSADKAKVLTDAFHTALSKVNLDAKTNALTTLVSNGTITTAQESGLLATPMVTTGLTKAQLDTVKSAFKSIVKVDPKSILSSVLASLTNNGTLTSDQANAISNLQHK